MQIKDNLKKIWRKHPFLLFANILSLILGVFPSVYFLFKLEFEVSLQFIVFLIPFLCVLGVSYLIIKIFDKYPLICRIISFCLNTVIIFIVQFLIGFILFAFLAFDINEKNLNKIENYGKAFPYFPQERIQHFPQKIPGNAQNVQLSLSTTSFFGSQSIYLIFDIDKDYIDNEINKHQYVDVIKYSNTDTYSYGFYTNFNLNNFTIYIINDKKHENPHEHSFPYHYGIGVNPEHTRILYYYEDPD